MQDEDGRDMREVQAGRVERFARLVERHQSGMFRYAQSRLGDRQAAEDAVQEAFLSAFASRKSYDPNRCFRAWLWQILVNQCHKLARKQLRRVGPLDVAAEPQDKSLPVSHRLETLEEQGKLTEALADLPDEQADAVRMRFFGGLTYEEIAEVVMTSSATVKSRVRYALAKLAERMQVHQETSR